VDVFDAPGIDLRGELAARDAELLEVLRRLGDLYSGLHASVGSDERLTSVVRAVQTLTSVGDAGVDRLGEVSRSLDHLTDALRALGDRVDALARRVEALEGCVPQPL
jgi:hypothetical protein